MKDWIDTDPRHVDRMRDFKTIPGFDGRVLQVIFRPRGADIVGIQQFTPTGAPSDDADKL
jgi:hypothetical protein